MVEETDIKDLEKIIEDFYSNDQQYELSQFDVDTLERIVFNFHAND